MTTKQVSYKRFIPKHLHSQAEGLLQYLTYYPFESPEACPHCGSTSFHLEPGASSRLDKSLASYFCLNCRHRFNQLTNTIFMFSRFLPLWGTLAKLYLAGIPLSKIAEELQISIPSVHNYKKKIDTYMKQQYPELDTWWSTHQQRTDKTKTSEIKQQEEFFLTWLHNLIYRRDYNCPHCNKALFKADFKKRHKILRPYFICYKCDYYLNVLKDTTLEKMMHMEKWIDFAKKTMEGYDNIYIEKNLSLNEKTASRWRSLFIKQMTILGLNELVQWLTWQRNQRHSVIITKTHQRKNNKS